MPWWTHTDTSGYVLTAEDFKRNMEAMLNAPPPPPALPIVSRSIWLDLMVLEHPDDARVPEWRRESRLRRIDWMKSAMRSGEWPWSRGPKGVLPR